MLFRSLDGIVEEPRIVSCNSTISGLQLPAPPDGELAASAVRESYGWGCSVSDTDAWSMQDYLARQEGIFVEPASALAAAALANDVKAGRLSSSARPVIVLTGSGLKDLRRFTLTTGSAERTFTISDLRLRLQAIDGNQQPSMR